MTVATSDPTILGRHEDSREYYRAAAMRGENYISNLVVGTTSGLPGVYFSGPVHDDRGAIVGVIALKLAGAAVSKILNHIQEFDTATQNFLVDNNGIVVVHPDRYWLYRSLGPLSPPQIEQIQERSGFPVDNIDCLCIPELARTLVGATQPNVLEYLMPGTEAPQVLGYAPMKSHFWTVAVSESEAAFEVPLRKLFRQVLVYFAVVGGVVMLLALVLGRTLVRPLHSLTQAVEALKNGDYDAAGPPPEGPTTSAPTLVSERFHLSEYHKTELARISAVRRDEIAQLALVFEDMVAKLQEYIVNLKTVTVAKERIEGEMKIAGDIQISLLSNDFSGPKARPELDLYALIHPAKQVGGDLYDFFFVDDDYLFFTIGDVSDKGMPAALFMAATLTLIRSLVSCDTPPDQVLSKVNRVLCHNNRAYQFITLFCGLLHLPSGEVRYSQGGHNPPYLFSPAQGTMRALTPVGGTALGIFDSAQYTTESLTLARGDVLFLYTDGVTEAMDTTHQLYGEARLEDCLRRLGSHDSPEAISQAVLADVKAFAGDASQSDDITVLCIRFLDGQ